MKQDHSFKKHTQAVKAFERQQYQGMAKVRLSPLMVTNCFKQERSYEAGLLFIESKSRTTATTIRTDEAAEETWFARNQRFSALIDAHDAKKQSNAWILRASIFAKSYH